MTRSTGSPSLQNDPLPDEHSIVRLVRPGAVVRDPVTRHVQGINAFAFELRPEDDGGLSCGWLEFYPGQRAAQIAASIATFKGTISVSKNAMFAVGNVGAVREACASMSAPVRVIHAPVPGHDAHSEVRRFNDQNLQLLELLAADVWAELHPP